ncbi:hypothetical protein HYALB_00007619 [Hymenoscyphus albidus]|uniref:Cytidyltransferase-like domain-containing protein n=1 Tax=Hymenoscyphus albidus TaxID=595503 RepID=A0A9N9Q507_9HELO|nr:hypothetical protein HYALB_00007619 [Hymenoscyphus albidus]
MAKTKSLLLLPPPPTIVDASSIAAAYKQSISATVSSLRNQPTSTELQVVLPCPPTPWSDTQNLLATFYGLFCLVCVNLDVDVDTGTPGSVDARVLLLDYDESWTENAGEQHALSVHAGPIVELPTLAITRYQWDQIFSVDGEGGQKLLAHFANLANQTSPLLSGQFHTVSGGIIMKQNILKEPQESIKSSSYHEVVAVGGTFDHLHAGHKLLLTATALLLKPQPVTSTRLRRLIVGITGDELLKNKKYVEHLGTWEQRQDDVVDFLLSILSFTTQDRESEVKKVQYNEPVPNGRAIHTTINSSFLTIECVEIQDPFGPTITDKSVTALVVSSETKSGGQAVNDKRVEKGWEPLEVYEVDVLDTSEDIDSSVKAKDFSSKISSSAIRKRIAETTQKSSL